METAKNSRVVNNAGTLFLQDVRLFPHMLDNWCNVGLDHRHHDLHLHHHHHLWTPMRLDFLLLHLWTSHTLFGVSCRDIVN